MTAGLLQDIVLFMTIQDVPAGRLDAQDAESTKRHIRTHYFGTGRKQISGGSRQLLLCICHCLGAAGLWFFCTAGAPSIAELMLFLCYFVRVWCGEVR